VKNEALETVIQDYQASKQWRESGWDSKSDEFYRLYRSQLDEREEHRANLNIPYVFQVIETVVPRLVGARPEIKAQPREESDLPQAMIVGELFGYIWETQKLNDELEKCVRDALMYGTGFARVDWNKTDGVATFFSVDPRKLYPDVTATKDKELQYVVHQYDMTVDDLEATGKYDVSAINELRKIETKKTADDNVVEQQRATDSGLASTDQPNVITKTNSKVQILEWWSPKRVITVAEKDLVIRDEDNPFGKIPFVSLRDYIIPHEYYGIGEIEHIQSLQAEANSLRNQIMDNTKLITNRMWKRRRAGGVNKNTLVSKTGGIVDVNDPSDIEPLDVQPLPGDVFELSQILKSDIQATTAVTDFAIGTGTTSLNDTATGVTLIQEAGNQRFRMKIRHLEDFINEVGNQMLAALQKWMSKKMVVRITNSSGDSIFNKVSKKEIQGRFDIAIETGSTQPVDRITERRNTVDLLNISASLPPGIANMRELYKRVLIKYNIKDPEILIAKEAPANDVEVMMTQMQPEEIEAKLAQMPPEDAKILQEEMGKILQEKRPEAMQQAEQG